MADGHNLFTSPELYKRLKTKNKDLPFDVMQNDSWALGMVLL